MGMCMSDSKTLELQIYKLLPDEDGCGRVKSRKFALFMPNTLAEYIVLDVKEKG